MPPLVHASLVWCPTHLSSPSTSLVWGYTSSMQCISHVSSVVKCGNSDLCVAFDYLGSAVIIIH